MRKGGIEMKESSTITAISATSPSSKRKERWHAMDWIFLPYTERESNSTETMPREEKRERKQLHVFLQ